jgi:hypothetical protein
MLDLRDEWVCFAGMSGFVAKSHITLTFDRSRFEGVTRERAIWLWERMVRLLNERVGGKRYQRKWGHSYFGYVMGVEHHKSGAIHAHVVVDNWVDYRLIHDVWNQWAGFAWIKGTDDPVSSLRYVLKYVVKEDTRPTWFFQSRHRLIDPATGRSLPSDTPPESRGVKDGVSVATRRAPA